MTYTEVLFSCIFTVPFYNAKLKINSPCHTISLEAEKVHVHRLAGLELTFFIAVHMALCFGFVARTVLIKHQCLGCC